MRRTLLLAVLLFSCSSGIGESFAREVAQPHDDVEVNVALDAAEQNGNARASIKIHAPQDVIWALITSCAEALNLVPGLVGCEVLETSPDGTWQLIRHVLDYSWYVPKLTYEIRATYERPSRVTVERVAGDLRVLRGSWTLKQDGESTIADYTVDLATGFWVPHWVIQVALRRDLPKMMRALRSRAEAR